jgi:hypothetical protein
MIKNLKNLVIFLGIIVLLLFSITIVSLIYKLKNRDVKSIENLELVPRLNPSSIVHSLEVSDNLLYLVVKEENGEQLVKIYNLKDGIQVGTINISE